jgi:hypothetical protein
MSFQSRHVTAITSNPEGLIALIKAPYLSKTTGFRNSGIKVTDQYCLKTLPASDTPKKWHPKAMQAVMQSLPYYRSLTHFSIHDAKLNVESAKHIFDRTKGQFVAEHYGFFRTHSNHPWVKAGYLRTGVHVVMQSVPGINLQTHVNHMWSFWRAAVEPGLWRQFKHTKQYVGATIRRYVNGPKRF